MLSAICFNLDQSKILSSGNEFILGFKVLSFNPLPHIANLNDSDIKAFENIVGKGENAFSPFPTMFSTLPREKI